MKTMMFRNIANPRRTTLAHLVDAEDRGPVGAAAEPNEPIRVLPARTANPRRTVLMEAPQQG